MKNIYQLRCGHHFLVEIINAYLSFPDEHTSASKVIVVYHNHPSVKMIRDYFGDTNGFFEFHLVSPSDISNKLKMLNAQKSTVYDDIPAKLFWKVESHWIARKLYSSNTLRIIYQLGQIKTSFINHHKVYFKERSCAVGFDHGLSCRVKNMARGTQ